MTTTPETPTKTAPTAAVRVRTWAGRAGTTLAAALLVGLCLLLAVTVLYPRARGYVPLTVMTGSMEPTYPVGSQVFVDPVEGTGEAKTMIEPGSAITFMPRPNDPSVITHRVVKISYGPDGTPRYTTRGDANTSNDRESVAPNQVRGVVRYHVPMVGHVATLMGSDRKTQVSQVAALALFLYAGANVFASARAAWRRNAGDSRGPSGHAAA